MVHADVIYLVNDTPENHGVFAQRTESQRMVYADVKSVGMNEFYKAKNAGIEPTYVFELSDYSEYEGEKVVIYNEKRYKVVRTYVSDMRLEITVEEATADA